MQKAKAREAVHTATVGSVKVGDGRTTAMSLSAKLCFLKALSCQLLAMACTVIVKKVA